MMHIDLQVIVECMLEAFSLGETYTYSPFGDSMLPTIQNGKYAVTFGPCPHPQVHDIVFYKRPSGNYILHRIVGKFRGKFMLCGDNENCIEYPIEPSAIFAKIIAVKDENGNAVQFHKKKFARRLWLKNLKLRIKKTLVH